MNGLIVSNTKTGKFKPVKSGKIESALTGRKNWLFSNTPRGALSSAVLYSLIESAKANGLEPYRYLRYIFDRLPGASSRDQLRALLPDMITPEMVKLS